MAVVPHLLKGGFVFGGENGRGVATCRTANGWSAPRILRHRRAEAGACRMGIEGIDLVMIIQNDKGMDDRKRLAQPTPQRLARWDVTLMPTPTGSWIPKSSPTGQGSLCRRHTQRLFNHRDDDSTEATYSHDVWRH